MEAKMKVVAFLSWFALILSVQLGAQNFSGQTTFSEKYLVTEKHEKLFSQFLEKTSRLTEVPEVYTEHIYQEWENEDWSNLIKEIITVDVSGETWIWTYEELHYSGSGWMKSDSMVTETTPLVGDYFKMLKSNTYGWNGTKWVHIFRVSFTYDEENLTEVLMEIALDDEIFGPFVKTEYQYTENNLPSSETESFYYGGWEYTNRILYFYDEEERLTEIIESYWNIDSWEDTLRTKNLYEDDEFPAETDYFIYEGGYESPLKRIAFEYSTSVLGLVLFEYEDLWLQNDWRENTKKSYEYNSIDQVTRVITEKWGNSGFELLEKLSYTYNSSNMETEVLLQTREGSEWVNKSRIISLYTISSVNEVDFTPAAFELYSNYPNPFNPSTTISYSLPAAAKVQLKVFNSLGEQVRLLVDEEQNAGIHKVVFQASGLSSGVYFYRLQAGITIETGKMILNK
jgi:hypothetical protein